MDINKGQGELELQLFSILNAPCREGMVKQSSSWNVILHPPHHTQVFFLTGTNLVIIASASSDLGAMILKGSFHSGLKCHSTHSMQITDLRQM